MVRQEIKSDIHVKQVTNESDSDNDSEEQLGDRDEDWDDFDDEEVEWEPTSPHGGMKRIATEEESPVSPYKRIMKTPQ